MAQLRGAFTNATDKDIRKVFFNEHAQYEAQYSKVFEDMDVDGKYEKFSRMYGLGAVPGKTEGGNVDVVAMSPAGEIEFDFPTYAFAVATSEEMLEDDRTGIFGNIGGEMARSVNYTLETLAWPILTAGFAANAGQSGTDSKTLFATDHPLGVTGSTQSNSSSNALSYTAVQSATTAFKKQRNDAGVPIMVKPEVLIVPPDLEWKARELMLSELEPDTANNAINNAAKEGLRYMVFNFGSSTTNWFLTTKKMANGLKSMYRARMKMTNYVDPNSGNKVTRVRFRYQAGHVDWRGAYGSTGA